MCIDFFRGSLVHDEYLAFDLFTRLKAVRQSFPQYDCVRYGEGNNADCGASSLCIVERAEHA